MAAFLTTASSAQTGYVGLLGGGPLYEHNTTYVNEVENSGFTEVIVWSMEVKSNGDLNFNGNFLIASGGAYVGASTYPDFASDLATMKQGTVKRITFSIGSSNVGDFQDIESLVDSQGTGPSSILYQNFAALKAALPVDAIDLDDENNYDSSSTIQFAEMLGGLGYHVMIDPYTNASYWTSVVSQINSQLPGTADGVHLQTYSGGDGNSPCSSSWNFGSVPVYPGVSDASSAPPTLTPAETESTIASWYSQCGITGGWLWNYDHIAGTGEASQYAAAISAGVQAGIGTAASLSSSFNRIGIYTDGTQFSSTGGLDGVGNAYSANLLGMSQTWNGAKFTFGEPNYSNVVSAGAQTISLPSGSFATLDMLATGVNGDQTSQTFTVYYTDGSDSVFTQSLSDWAKPQSYSGESEAVTMSYRDKANGGMEDKTYYLYGYSFPLNDTKTVSSIVLPSDSNVEVVAITLVP